MPQLRCSFGGRTLLVLALIFPLNTLLGSDRCYANQGEESLQLEVFINGVPANMISAFVRFTDGKIGAKRSELEELGLRIEVKYLEEDIVLLEDIPTLRYAYVERLQRILIVVGDRSRIPHAFDLHDSSAVKAPPAQAGWGTVLNYDLLATTGNVVQPQPIWIGGTSLTLDARAFSPYGTLGQSALLLAGQGVATEAIRLDSSYRYSDQERMISYDVGDAITGGLAWTRPIRIGGLQAQSNFALRPDLVTMPLPALGGTAAVPSTVDVYVNNIKTFSQEVGAGPFTVSNIPLVSGGGTAQLVVRDSSGQATTTSLPFYASANLLAPGLTGWSVETGFPRLGYGSTADTYVATPVASATLRRGLFDWLTLEGHAEGGSGLLNGGAGAAVRTGAIGVAEASLAGSTLSGSAGLQSYVAYDTSLFGLTIHVSAQQTFGNYNDLASATARLQNASTASAVPLDGALSFLPYAAPTNVPLPSIYTDSVPPLALDQISVGAAFPFDPKASWSLSYLREIAAATGLSNIVAASYSRPLPYDVSLFATAFVEFGANKSAGIVVGFTVPFGKSGSVTSSVSGGQGGTVGTVDAVQPLGYAIGDYGWEVRDSEGASPYRQATLSYRTDYLTAKVGASQDQGNSTAGVELRGSVAEMGGDVFFSDWIDKSFAVVDAGAPGVEVSYENRPLGKTDTQGMLLVPTLRPYEKNSISIDPANLPADAELASTHDVVAPADRAGVLVRFNVQSDTTAALVVFTTADGSFVSPGATGTVTGGDEFIVGYDGQAFIKGLKGSNSVTISFNNAVCHADFNFVAQRGEQVRIGPVVCQ